MKRVSIHYRRLPDRLHVYDQRVLQERDDVVVTLSEPLELDEPMLVDDEVLLERGSRAVWFTFPGLWHDIGRFYTADGRFSGLYANVLTPAEMAESVWRTTDLFLDVWWPRSGAPKLLDRDELEEALTAGHIDPVTAERARTEAARIMTMARSGRWPPPIVSSWTLERALTLVGAS